MKYLQERFLAYYFKITKFDYIYYHYFDISVHETQKYTIIYEIMKKSSFNGKNT